MCLAHPLKPFEIYNISHFYFDFEVKNVYKFIPIDLELPVLMFFPDLFILVYFIKFPMLASNMTACLSPTPGAELVIPVLQDPLVHPSVAPRAPFIPTLSTHHSLLTIVETTKDSLSKATEAGVPCLSNRGSDDCDDDGLVISGYGSGEAF